MVHASQEAQGRHGPSSVAAAHRAIPALAIIYIAALALPAAALTRTPGPTFRRHGNIPPTYTKTVTPTPTPTILPERSSCLGDRDGDWRVAVNELVLAVSVALETTPLATFPQLDFDHSQRVEIDELMRAVNNALDGCPSDLVISSVHPYYPGDQPPGCNPHEVFVCVTNHGPPVEHEFNVVVIGEVYRSDARFYPGLASEQEGCFTFAASEIGPPIIGGGDLPEFRVEVDSLGEIVETNEENNVETVVLTPVGVCTPTPTPSGELQISSASGNTFSCQASFEITLTNVSTIEPLVIDRIVFHHGYSQGFYSTGFTVLNADEVIGHGQDQIIHGPIVLGSGEVFTIPVEYNAGRNNSRLAMGVYSSSIHPEQQGAGFYGYGCPSPVP